MAFKIESDCEFDSDWIPKEKFKEIFTTKAEAVAMAIEAVDDPEIQEVRIIDVETGDVVCRTTELNYEQ